MDFLETIAREKRHEVAGRKVSAPASALLQSPWYDRERRSLRNALLERDFGIIAEVKKASPSKGVIRQDFDHVAIARQYADAGAAGLSVLTDEKFFGGRLEFLTDVKGSTLLPVLRKDFVIDEYQIVEARSIGADAVLLIAALLEPPLLREFCVQASELGLEVLLEVHNEAELEGALAARPAMLGINNRDLQSFQVDLGVTSALMPMIPREFVCVSESGISAGSDLVQVKRAGCRGALIGEWFMRQQHPGDALRAILTSLEEQES
jgi:indole-3-glycerol phosphate synthase